MYEVMPSNPHSCVHQVWVTEILGPLLETVGWADRAHPHRTLRLMDIAGVK